MAQQMSGAGQSFLGDMHIALCGIDISMPQQRGDGIQVGALRQQQRGAGMAQAMEGEVLAGDMAVLQPYFQMLAQMMG